jgi:RimJ/RimL family protein N-acetyltransferase
LNDPDRVLRLRPATVADSDLFLSLRNDPESVRQSGGTRVDPTDHITWFRSAVAAADQRLWVAVVGGVDVGYARLRIDGGTGLISLALAPSSRGSGLGVAVLHAVQRQVATDPAIDRLVGEVEPTNVASRRAFERAGFTPEPGSTGRVVLSWSARSR